MGFKSILLTAALTLGLTAATMAQVPNYVPTNGLVGWWPFNGNANDESGNGNNGNVNGATLAEDRNGSNNSAYFFDGNNFTHISIPNNPDSSLNLTQDLTISSWFYSNSMNDFNSTVRSIVMKSGDGVGDPNGYTYGVWAGTPTSTPSTGTINFQAQPNNNSLTYPTGNSGDVQINQWYCYVVTYTKNDSILQYYLNGVLIDAKIIHFDIGVNSNDLWIGSQPSIYSTTKTFNGKIDDIGIWNRALSQQEITALYNASNCANNTSITPQSNSLSIGSTATFTASTADPNPSFVWQSDYGQGFQTLNNFGNYSGVNSATLNIANVQLSEHNQPIRVISTSGNCIDTSNVAVINILDTCITNVTGYDTLLTTVTDTLVINATITGINPPNNLNTLKVFPNPASTHITIDYGNFNTMSGYTLKIVNSVGQTVFTTPINQQTSYIDLSTWTGNGIYFVQLIDPQNNTIENRKIVIQ
jgi:hypothetical protein